MNLVAHKFAHVERGPEDMHGYQIGEAVPFLEANPFSALFIDMGMGKTVISLTVIMRLVQQYLGVKVLVIGPRKVVNETWPTEIGLWEHTAPLSCAFIRDEMFVEAINRAGRQERQRIKQEVLADMELFRITDPETIKREIDVCILSDKSQYRIEQARIQASRIAVKELMRRSRASVYLISRDNVEQLVNALGRDWCFPVVFIDESSSFKDHKSGRFKALRKVRPLIKRLHELTASPAAETYLHLFAQIYLLDEGKRLGKSFTNYQQRYFTQNRYTQKWALRPGAREEIVEKISDICMVMKAENYLPPMEVVNINDTIVLSDEEMALYKGMESDFIVQLKDGTIVEAETAASRSQKLVQMASGVLYETVLSPDEYGEFTKNRIVHHLHDHKIAKLEEIVEGSQGETILVAYHLKSSLERLKKAFPHAVVMDKDGKCVKAWNAGKIQMLLVSPQSAGHGLNIQHGGRRIVFFDIPWSLELYEQTVGRLARQGQKLVVMVHHILCADSIDWEVVKCLQDKNASQEMLFKLLWDYQKQPSARYRSNHHTRQK